MFLQSKSKVETPESLTSACRTALDEHKKDIHICDHAIDSAITALYLKKHTVILIDSEKLKNDPESLAKLRTESIVCLRGMKIRFESFVGLKQQLITALYCPDALKSQLNLQCDDSWFFRILGEIESRIGQAPGMSFRDEFRPQLQTHVTALIALEESLSAFITQEQGKAETIRDRRAQRLKIGLALSVFALTVTGFFALLYSVSQKQSTASVAR